MTLQLEEGKFYRTRGGMKIGPMAKHKNDPEVWFGSTEDGQEVSYIAPNGIWRSENGNYLSIVALDDDQSILPAPPAHDPQTAPAMTIQQARIEALRIALSTQPWVLVVEELDNVERAAQFIIEGVK